VETPDWKAEQAKYQAAIAAGAGGEAYQGLATALFWQNDVNGAIRSMERAYVLFQGRGDHGRAAWAALWLGGQYLRYMANPAVASGWIGRSKRLISQAAPSPETGRVILMHALATAEPAEIERAADRAMEIARQFGDSDYEALALAYSGLAMLSLGRLKEGVGRLDEAMASVTAGAVRAPEAIGQIYCALLSGCERTADFQRADQWRLVADPFLETYARTGLTGTCRATYAGVLAATGNWSQAEHELLEALRIFGSGARAMRADAAVRLADLRVRQGRLDDAARLLEGYERHPDAQQPLAELELARGRPRVASALLERRIKQLGETNLQAGPMLLQLTEARLAGGDVAASRDSASALVKLGARGGGDCLHGLAYLASGLVTAASGGDPVPELEAALDHLERARMTWEAARARLAVADAVARFNPGLAIREARLAMESFRTLGAGPGADRARSLLRGLGISTGGGPALRRGLSRREQDVARLVGLGLSNDQIAARLFLSPRTVEHHITSILRKLPASRRAEIAAYATRHLGSDSG
jgi:DNA-binding CsgD family transcriptional regulator/tetratricopeptide (TPR) repeat protein